MRTGGVAQARDALPARLVEVVLAALAVDAKGVLATVDAVAAVAGPSVQVLVKVAALRAAVTLAGCGRGAREA